MATKKEVLTPAMPDVGPGIARIAKKLGVSYTNGKLDSGSGKFTKISDMREKMNTFIKNLRSGGGMKNVGVGLRTGFGGRGFYYGPGTTKMSPGFPSQKKSTKAY